MTKIMGAQTVYDEESDFNIFKNAFLYDACLFIWDEAQQANAIVYCLKGKAKQVFKGMDAGKQKDIKEVFKELKMFEITELLFELIL